LLWRYSICIVLWIGPKECVCSMRCFAKFEVLLFVLNAALCSLNRAKKFLPVCPTYVLLQSGQVSLYCTLRTVCICRFCLLSVYCANSKSSMMRSQHRRAAICIMQPLLQHTFFRMRNLKMANSGRNM